jgi:hypothetical protein
MGLGGHIFRWFFNLVGGTSRWVWGTIWRTLFKKKKFKYSEYIKGPDTPDYYDNMTSIKQYIDRSNCFFLE